MTFDPRNDPTAPGGAADQLAAKDKRIKELEDERTELQDALHIENNACRQYREAMHEAEAELADSKKREEVIRTFINSYVPWEIIRQAIQDAKTEARVRELEKERAPDIDPCEECGEPGAIHWPTGLILCTNCAAKEERTARKEPDSAPRQKRGKSAKRVESE